MTNNPPNPCREGGKFCTRFETKEQARYHYHLYHSKIYRGHYCSRDPSCGRKFHEENDARDHDCNGESNIVANLGGNLFSSTCSGIYFTEKKEFFHCRSEND